jgi:GxxExxY protein
MKGRTREFSELSTRVIGAAIEVHRVLGPGLLESTYRRCLAHEMVLRGMAVAVEQPLPIVYKGLTVESAYRIDLMIEDEIIVEIKCVANLADAHQKQLLTYMKLSGIRVGFLMNFTRPRLMEGLVSFVL